MLMILLIFKYSCYPFGNLEFLFHFAVMPLLFDDIVTIVCIQSTVVNLLVRQHEFDGHCQFTYDSWIAP